jgi:chemotaxis signal transduction protein
VTNQRARETVVLFYVGSCRFAIAANAVEEICGLDHLTPLADGCGRSRAIRHTFERRGKRLLAVDAQVHFRMREATPQHVLILRGADIGILIGGIDRMHEMGVVRPLPRGLSGEERKWYRGVTLIGREITPVVDPRSFLPYGNAVPEPLSVAARAREAIPA